MSPTATPARVRADEPPDVRYEPPSAVPYQPPVAELAAARRGCPTAWAALFNRYHRLVLAVARRHGLTAAECDDVAQFTWLRLVENIGRIRSDASLAGWLVTTSTREAYATTRRRARERPTADTQDVADPSTPDDIDDRLDIRTAATALRRLIRILPDRERRLLELMLDPAELSYRQISAVLDMPVGAIGPVRQRAIRRLQGLLAAQSPWADDADALTAS
jgi:RNA polymerase sigma factor (sigma-70 family)